MHAISGPALCLTLATALGATLLGCGDVGASAGDDVGDEVVADAGVEPTMPDAEVTPEVDADVSCMLDCGARGACVDPLGDGSWACQCDVGYQGASCETCAPGYGPDPDDAAACALALPSTTGLALWLDTTVLSSFQVSGNAVASWQDRRGSGVTMTAPVTGARPTYVGAALNGRAVVRFGGDDDLASPFAGLRGADYTVFVVMKPGPLGGDILLRAANLELGTTLRFERVTPGTSYRLTHDAPGAGAGDQVSAGFGNTSSTKLLVLRRWTSGLLDHLRLIGNDGDALDGIDAVQSSLVEPAIDVTHTLHLGDADLQGDVAEVLVYDRAIPDAELAQIQAYLAAKWGVE